MGKKYLDTKKSSLESSILGVWENAVSETVERAKANLDARTKEYKVHQEKLAASRLRRENSKKVTKEELDLDEKFLSSFLRITFKKQADVKKAMKVADTDFGRGYFMLDPARTRPELDIEGDKDDLENLKDSLKKAGIQFEIEMEEEVELDEGTKEEYEKFFNATLKKFKIDSPADLKSDEEKKKFFNYIDKNYTGEKDEEYDAFMKEMFNEDMFTEEETALFELDDEEFDEAMKKKSSADRLKAKKKRDKYKKTPAGKAAAKKAKKRAARVRSGAIKIDPAKSRAAKKRAKLYSGDEVKESFEIGTDEYRDYALNVTPGETDPEWARARDFKVASMKEALAKVWGME